MSDVVRFEVVHVGDMNVGNCKILICGEAVDSSAERQFLRENYRRLQTARLTLQLEITVRTVNGM